MTLPPERPTNTPAIVALVAAIVALPSFVFGITILAWAAALTGLIAGIAGVRRAFRGAQGMILSWVAIALSSIILITLAGLLILLLLRPFR